MKKEFVFSAKFDTSEFDRSIEQMQKRLKDLYAPADMMRMQRDTSQRLQQSGMGGIMSAPSVEAYRKATQASRREIDQMISEQAKGQEKLGKIIAQRSDLLKKLQDQQRQMVKDSKEELEIKEKIARVEANNQQLRETYRQRDAAMNQAIDARESMKPQGLERLVQAYQGGGIGGVARAGMRMAGPAGILGIAGSVVGTIGSLGETGANIYRDWNRAPIRTEAAMGSAVQGSLGRNVQDIYGRRSAFEQAFSPERNRAAAQALEQSRTDYNADRAQTGFGLLKNIGVGITGGAIAGGAYGAGAGALAGAGILSLPGAGIGAAGGALIGGAAGGAAALGKGLWGIATDERKRALAFSPFSETMKKRYESLRAEDLVKSYETSYEAQKQQNPFKTAAIKDYEQNYQRNLDQQRAMGLRNEEFYGKGGFQEKAMNQGFTPEMAMQMSSGILGAGGSTRMARESAFGLQMQRGMDLTNANQILGTLSGGLGSSESTKQATIKVLAEGMKLGLDDSKFAEENRRFTQMTAEIIARSGAKGENDFQRIASGFGRFVGENTNEGISAAKEAYEEYQQVSQSTTGPRGVMRAAGFLSDPSLSKLSTITKQGLLGIREDELSEDHPLVKAAAEEAKISPKELISSMSSINQNSMSRFKASDEARNRIKSYMANKKIERLSESDISNLPENVKNDFNELIKYQSAEFGGANRRKTMDRALGAVNPAESAAEKQLGRENITQDKLTSVERTGRMEDTTIKAMAADSKVVLDNFNEMAPAMDLAAKSTEAWTRQVREANAVLQQALELARQNKTSQNYQSVDNAIRSQISSVGGNQQQSGRQSK